MKFKKKVNMELIAYCTNECETLFEATEMYNEHVSISKRISPYYFEQKINGN